jgi:hypothetical protein
VSDVKLSRTIPKAFTLFVFIGCISPHQKSRSAGARRNHLRRRSLPRRPLRILLSR